MSRDNSVFSRSVPQVKSVIECHLVLIPQRWTQVDPWNLIISKYLSTASEKAVTHLCTSHAVQHINNAHREWFHKSIITPVWEIELMYGRREQGHTRPQTCSNTLQIYQIKLEAWQFSSVLKWGSERPRKRGKCSSSSKSKSHLSSHSTQGHVRTPRQQWSVSGNEWWVVIYFAAVPCWTNHFIIQSHNILHYDKDTYISIYEWERQTCNQITIWLLEGGWFQRI